MANNLNSPEENAWESDRKRKRNKRICSFIEYSNINILTFNYTDTDTSQTIHLKIKKIVIFAEEMWIGVFDLLFECVVRCRLAFHFHNCVATIKTKVNIATGKIMFCFVYFLVEKCFFFFPINKNNGFQCENFT